MKQSLIFFIMLFCALMVDLNPVYIDQLKSETITVYVQGEVLNEGALELPMYATIGDALAQVELTTSADISNLNLLTVLKDKDVIEVPVLRATTITKVSINYGTVSELDSLPGIGESTANKIIAYREENGLFQSLEDIMEVSGIGEAKFAKIKDYITL